MAIISGGASIGSGSISNAKNTYELTGNETIKKDGVYDVIDTEYKGIKRVVSHHGGFVVHLDYGEVYKVKKDGTRVLGRDKTVLHVDKLSEARELQASAVDIRKKRKESGPEAVISTTKKIKITVKDAIEMYKKEGAYADDSSDGQIHADNHLNHIIDYMGDYEPARVTIQDIINYFNYQLQYGYLIYKNDKRVAEKGISVNTLGKHKTTLKKLWNYMITSKKFGVTENVVTPAQIPKVKIVDEDGCEIKVSKIPYTPQSLSIDELNYTLNDLIQNEFDRSLLLLVAVASIGGLRRGEIQGLQVGKFFHDERMKISDTAFTNGGYIRNEYTERDDVFMVDIQIKKERGKRVVKRPKSNRIRVVAKPNILNEIVAYCMEQRIEINNTLISESSLYMPIVNIIENRELVEGKMTRKWMQYQKRRNKRMVEMGLEPIKIVRLHDLRHTHANLLKVDVPTWIISYNMGHVVNSNGIKNTTTGKYWDDRDMYRKPIIEYWDTNIKIDWDKAMNRHINDSDSIAYINGSGQLVIGDGESKRIKYLKKKSKLSEEEYEELLSGSLK